MPETEAIVGYYIRTSAVLEDGYLFLQIFKFLYRIR